MTKSDPVPWGKQLLLSASEDKSVVLWDLASEPMVDKIELDWTPNYVEGLPGNRFIICDVSKNIKIFKYHD